ncbi:MAG: response regulator, partial [Solirubrobacteraceae bacterium]
KQITVDAKGEILELKDTINTMVEQLRSFAAEVTRVAREVGTEGNLGGQAEVEGVSGTWRGLTENVNGMASNLTDQVRNIAQVATAVANGDLSKQITVDAKGEILELKDTINTMVEQLRSFAAEVTRVAREVGTEGKLGGQAEVAGVSGTWRGLTENVNQLAGNLTTQVRAIAEVSTAVTQGDLTRSIAVEAQGEVAELKDNINQMIANLRDTTKRNEEQDWLKTNLARISGLMQGQRELRTVSQLIMSELTPTVSAQHGAFFLAEVPENGPGEVRLRLIASYGYSRRAGVPDTFRLGEGLVGQAAVEKKSILIGEAPAGYIRISSGLGEAKPANIIVMPLLFEEQLLGVIELASLAAYSEVHRTFLAQLMETLGVVLNTIMANMRTEELLQQSQSLTQELQNQSEELQAKAALLEERNRDIETKNREIDLARMGVEEKASQLALSSQYKSEFLANMSHELRTPLNSLLILSKMLAANENGNLDAKQLEFARTIHSAGTDLLELISDILDLSKIEAGKMEVLPDAIRIADVQDYVSRTFRPVASDKGLAFEIIAANGLPETVVTDAQRLQQVLKNLLSNAFKFTERGGVTLSIELVDPELVRQRAAAAPLEPDAEPMLAFRVSDTGVGIAADKVAVVFEAFQQADGTTSRKYGGTGLGLSISREIVSMLGGALDVTSTPGVGSTFTLYLPLTFGGAEPPVVLDPLAPAAPTTRPGDAATARHDAAALAITEPAPGSGASDDGEEPPAKRLLVVDPGDGVTRAIGGLIGADKGVSVVTAETPAEALGVLAGDARPWDCIIVALTPPRQAGLDFLEALRAHPASRLTPVIAYTTRPLSKRQQARLAESDGPQAMRLATTPARLLGETAMVLHRRDGGGGGGGAPSMADEHGERATVDLRGKKILLVDDDVRNLFALASLLEDRGIEVVFGETGKEALAALERHPDIDLVLMDIMMPDMDGYETTAAIRAMPRFEDLPIIALTAKAMQGDREKSLSSGASDHITKPVDPGRLLTVLKSWMA